MSLKVSSGLSERGIYFFTGGEKKREGGGKDRKSRLIQKRNEKKVSNQSFPPRPKYTFRSRGD